MRRDTERVCDEMSGIGLGPSGCRDGVGTGVERVITQSQHTDGPPALQLDQAIMENESNSPSRTIQLMI